MDIVIDYKPTEKQKMFHDTIADEVLFGGAAGGGKSTAVVMEALKCAIKISGTQCFLFRRTYKELNDTLILTAKMLIPKSLGRYNSSEHNFVLANDSVLKFRHCQNEMDKYMYQGVEINYLFVDELTHFSKGIYDFLKTRLRANVKLGIKPRIRCTSNPGGIGHSWVKKRFISRAEPYEIKSETTYSEVLKKSAVHTLQYIPASVLDNPYINEEYIFELERKPKQLRDALLKGDWDTFVGQAFCEFKNNSVGYSSGKNTHVIQPFLIPSGWRIYRSFDFGYSKPFSVLWWAVDYENKVYLIHEWYGALGADTGIRLNPKEIAEGIKKREKELFSGRGIYGVADPSIWDKSRGQSIAEQMESEGIYFAKGDNSRLAGKMQFHIRLTFSIDERPMMYVFSTCNEFIRTFPALTLDQYNVEDVDTRCEDHAYDSARYFLMCVPVCEKDKKAKRLPFNPLEDNVGYGGSGFMGM